MASVITDDMTLLLSPRYTIMHVHKFLPQGPALVAHTSYRLEFRSGRY